MARRLGLWLPVALFMGGVWFLSDDLSVDVPQTLWDKGLHFAAYGLFGLANLRAFHGGFRRPRLWGSLAALALTCGFGALDEWRQAGIELRHASGGDWIADSLGGLAAWAALCFVYRHDRPERPAAGES